MIHIVTDEGLLLDVEDSIGYIIWEIENEFSNITEFKECKEINKSSYWGNCILLDSEECYSKWLHKIAEITLKL